MQYNEIEFYESEKVGKVGLGMYLPGHYWVEKKWFVLAWHQIAARMPTIDKSKEYFMRSLCGEEFWGQYQTRDCFKLGRCMKFFVSEELVPFYITNPHKKSGPHKYRFLRYGNIG